MMLSNVTDPSNNAFYVHTTTSISIKVSSNFTVPFTDFGNITTPFPDFRNATSPSTIKTKVPTSEDKQDPMTSDNTEKMCRYIIDLWICSFLSYFGIITNIMTIIVFVKMNFQEVITISLTIIAIWDLLRCVCFAFIRVYGLIDLVSPAEAESWNNVMRVIVGYAYSIAGYVSGVSHGYVAFERCLCISRPHTVKQLLTKKIVICTNLGLSFIVIGSYACVYALYTFYWTYSPKYNESILVYSYSKIYREHPALEIYITTVSMFWPIFAFIVICVCTAVIARYLRKASSFRNTQSSRVDTSTTNQLTARDRKVIKVLFVIIAIYIVCFFPRIVFFIPRQLVRGFYHRGKYHNTMWVYVYVMSIFDLTNSSINLIAYYIMSSQFRNAFLHIICCRGKKN